MPRSRPPLRLERNPLIIVLAQARISPVLKLAEWIPDIQERLRGEGFPRFSAVQQSKLAVTPDGQIAGQGPWAESTYHFADRETTSAVVLSTQAVTLETTTYSTFEDFLALWERVAGPILDVLKPDIIERVGLRYVDLIQPRPGERLEDWLQPGLMGLHGLPITQVKSRYELRAASTVGQLVLIATRPESGFIPGELQPFPLSIAVRGDLEPFGYLVLDLDHFSEASVYDRGSVTEVLWSLHDLLDLAFRETVTEKALKAWRSN